MIFPNNSGQAKMLRYLWISVFLLEWTSYRHGICPKFEKFSEVNCKSLVEWILKSWVLGFCEWNWHPLLAFIGSSRHRSQRVISLSLYSCICPSQESRPTYFCFFGRSEKNEKIVILIPRMKTWYYSRADMSVPINSFAPPAAAPRASQPSLRSWWALGGGSIPPPPTHPEWGGGALQVRKDFFFQVPSLAASELPN